LKKILSFLLALLLAAFAVGGTMPAAFADEGSAYIEITKPPYGETVTEGDDATFISRAEGYQGLIWMFVSPDGETVWENETAIDAFPGLELAGVETEELHLISIPYSMNGWFIQTKFFDRNGDYVITEPAEVTVLQGVVPSPSIVSKSAGARLVPGESKTLFVEANSRMGDEIKYQWYRSYSAYRDSGEAILGATGPSYTPPEEIGQVFYFVGVWCIRGRDTSAPIYTPPVAIIYSEAAPTPAPAPSTAPAQAPSAPQNSGGGNPLFSHGNALLLVLSVILLVTALAIAVTLIVLRSVEKRHRAPSDETDDFEPDDENE